VRGVGAIGAAYAGTFNAAEDSLVASIQPTRKTIQRACLDIRDCDSTSILMYRTRIRALLLIVLATAASCGDNIVPPIPVDAATVCNYTETSDSTNDVMAEATGLTLGGLPQAICGDFEPNHFNSTLHSADDDRYRVSVSAATPTLIELMMRDASHVLSGATIRFWTIDAQPQLVGIATYDPSLADHGAFIITLPAGNYDMVVSGDASSAITGSAIYYRVRFEAMPACDETTDPPTYAEANDASGANDTVAVDFSKDPSFTPIAGTSPEASSITADTKHSYSIAGTLDNLTARADQYLDRDAYQFTTDETSNEVAVRVTWPSTTSDVDYIVFEAATMKPVVASNLSSDTGPELAMFAVKPSTSYLLWIGNFTGSAPTTYRATVCGNRYAF